MSTPRKVKHPQNPNQPTRRRAAGSGGGKKKNSQPSTQTLPLIHEEGRGRPKWPASAVQADRYLYDSTGSGMGRPGQFDWVSGVAADAKRGARQRIQRAHAAELHLGPAARNYLLALEKPWNAQEVGIPKMPSMPSFKFTAFARGTLSTSSTTGVGFVAMNPKDCFANDSTGPNGVSYSLASYTGTSLQHTATGVSNAALNSPFAASQVGVGSTKVQFRLVAAGIRVRYKGTQLEAGGVVYGFEHPFHSSLTGYDSTSLLAFRNVRRFAVSGNNRGWFGQTFHPINTADWEYTSDVVNGTMTLALLIEAATASTPVLYEWEAWGCYETIGAPAADEYSDSDTDSYGFSAVIDATTRWLTYGQKLVQDASGSPAAQALLHAVGLTAIQSLSYMTPALVNPRQRRIEL